MTLHRREFLLKASAGLAASLVAGSALRGQSNPLHSVPPPATLNPSPGEFVRLRRNVGIFTGFGGAIGWLLTPDGFVVVDSQFPRSAAEFLTRFPDRRGRTVDVLINTHHHPDHTGGNSAFRVVTQKIVAHATLVELQRAHATREHATHFQVYADTTFRDRWQHDVGDERVSVRFVGKGAHTGSDAIVYFEKANIVHMGDLVFNRRYPNVDRLGGARVGQWIEVLEQTVREYPADALYIFSHGKPEFGLTGSRADVLIQRDYLSGFLDFVGKAIKAGKSREELLVAQEIPGFADWRSERLPFFWASSIVAAWDELTNAPVPQTSV